MFRALSRRLIASLVLGLFFPTAAFSSTYHACCMVMGGEHHGGMGTMAPEQAATSHVGHPPSHASSSERVMDGGMDHGAAEGLAPETESSESPVLMNSAVCDCMASGAGAGAPASAPDVDAAAIAAALTVFPIEVRTSALGFLLPYPNGPPTPTV